MKRRVIHDQRHLRAAQGWFELGLHLEANEELENITAEYRAHPPSASAAASVKMRIAAFHVADIASYPFPAKRPGLSELCGNFSPMPRLNQIVP